MVNDKILIIENSLIRLHNDNKLKQIVVLNTKFVKTIY
jgi:hypothetical protein